MAGTQPQDICALLTSFDLMHRAQADEFAQGAELFVSVVPPQQCASEQWRKERREDERLFDDEHAAHEYDEDDDAPDKPNERDRPRLAL